MANMGWNSKNHYPRNNAQIACRFCGQVFPNREALIAHVDSHLARQTHPKASSRDQALRSHQLAVMPNNLSIRATSSSSLPHNLQQVNRNVFGPTRPLAPEVNPNVSQNRHPVPEVNRNGSDALSLMQKVSRNDFNALPLVQQGNNRINNAANTHHQTFSWTSQPRPGPSTVTRPAPPPRRTPSLLTYVPPSAPAGSLQPPQRGFSSATTRNSTRGCATRQRSQQRNVREVAATTTEQTTRPFIDMLEKPIKKVDFIDLETMDEDGSEGSQKKLDLALKL